LPQIRLQRFGMDRSVSEECVEIPSRPARE
jgi:hypothetical protein